MSKPILPIFERHAGQSTEMVTLFYSEKAAKTYGAYTATIPDGNSEKTVTYTCPVSTEKKTTYLWDDKKEVVTCKACDVKEVRACTNDEMRDVLGKKPLSALLQPRA